MNSEHRMKTFLVPLLCLAVGCWGQDPPHKCKSPPLLTGHFTLMANNLFANARYVYNAYDQRIRITDYGFIDNTTLTFDGLLYFPEIGLPERWTKRVGRVVSVAKVKAEVIFIIPEGQSVAQPAHVIYLISEENQTCIKRPLKDHFRPMEVPKEAGLMGSTVLGSTSVPLEGLDISTWMGLSEDKVPYIYTVTMFGCIPIAVAFHTNKYGLVTASFYDNVRGVEDPEWLYPPPFCHGVTLSKEEFDFLSLFRKH